MSSKSTALIVRNPDSPSPEEWRDRERREREDRLWEERKRQVREELDRQRWWGWMAGAMVGATCLLSVAILIDISRERRHEPGAAGRSTTAAAPPAGAETSQPTGFDDPSPITDPFRSQHQRQFGGVALEDQATGHFSFRNRITGEDVSTVGQLCRYQAMLAARDATATDATRTQP